jgi:hypothetical protein
MRAVPPYVKCGELTVPPCGIPRRMCTIMISVGIAVGTLNAPRTPAAPLHQLLHPGQLGHGEDRGEKGPKQGESDECKTEADAMTASTSGKIILGGCS